jgi:hypothetical protein
MTLYPRKYWIGALITLVIAPQAFAQKVSVGYDKSADFSKYTTYTWAEPAMPPSRPLLYLQVVDSIDYELKSKGLTRTESNGDLILVPAGGMDYGINSAAGTPVIASFSGAPPAINATMWTGAGGASHLMATYVSEGTLMLNLVDRGTNTITWSGTVTQKLDMQNANKSMSLVDKAVIKLLKDFPPKKR